MELVELLKEYWTVLGTIAGIIYSYAVLKLDIREHNRRLEALEEKVGKIDPIWIEIKERLVAIETTLKLLTKEK